MESGWSETDFEIRSYEEYKRKHRDTGDLDREISETLRANELPPGL